MLRNSASPANGMPAPSWRNMLLPSRRYRYILATALGFAILGILSLGDFEGYRTRIKGYIPSSLGSLGSLGLATGDGPPCDAYVRPIGCLGFETTL